MKEYRRFWDTMAWRWIKTIIEILAIIAVIWGFIYAWTALGFAYGEEWDEHEEEYEIAYVICMKNDHVNIRPFPNKKQEPSGQLYPGDIVYMDGKAKNGYVHCVGLNNEAGEGWVSKGYLVADPPEYLNRTATIVSKGRLAARKNVNGKRTRWLKPLATVRVYYWSESWALTDCGYVQAKYLELDGE